MGCVVKTDNINNKFSIHTYNHFPPHFQQTPHTLTPQPPCLPPTPLFTAFTSSCTFLLSPLTLSAAFLSSTSIHLRTTLQSFFTFAAAFLLSISTPIHIVLLSAFLLSFSIPPNMIYPMGNTPQHKPHTNTVHSLMQVPCTAYSVQRYIFFFDCTNHSETAWSNRTPIIHYPHQ